MLWALGVGYVISGMYFGWNLGLVHAGPFGFLAATLIVTVLYVSFVMSYAELSCAIPRAGGAFIYAQRALGPRWGFFAGAAQWVEFVFAMPAIAAAIGAYLGEFYPAISPHVFAAGAYVVFTLLNILGVKQSAVFELCITVVAVFELLIFAGVTLPHFSWAAFSSDALPSIGWWGIFPAIPYAIWFYVCIEGIANVAEESRDPQKDLARGFGTAMVTLVVLAVLVFFSAVGVAGWKAIVFEPGGAMSDRPLPLAIRQVIGQSHVLYRLLVGVGLCGLVASFHGIMLAGSRATFEFGRVGYAPGWVGRLDARRGTPVAALLVNMVIGFLALATGATQQIITMAIFGALTMYIISIFALFRLRKAEPDLHRPYRTPFYPWVPTVALVLSVMSLLAMVVFHTTIALAFVVLLLLGYAFFRRFYRQV